MPNLSIIWWRDIPAQVVAKDARRSSKVVLHPRFQVAIDKAANRAGMREYNATSGSGARPTGRAATTSKPRSGPRPSASRRTTPSTTWPN